MLLFSFHLYMKKMLLTLLGEKAWYFLGSSSDCHAYCKQTKYPVAGYHSYWISKFYLLSSCDNHAKQYALCLSMFSNSVSIWKPTVHTRKGRWLLSIFRNPSTLTHPVGKSRHKKMDVCGGMIYNEPYF